MVTRKLTTTIHPISLPSHLCNPLMVSTGHPSLREHHEQESSLQPTSSRNRMARCVVLRGTRSMQKHADLSTTARYAFSTRQGCPIVVGVRCGNSVWDMETRPRDLAASALWCAQLKGHPRRQRGRWNFLPQRTPSCGGIGVGVRPDAHSFVSCTPKPSPSP
jgi:hypothetical protein